METEYRVCYSNFRVEVPDLNLPGESHPLVFKSVATAYSLPPFPFAMDSDLVDIIRDVR
jgi:hypothetical protein